MTRVTHLGLLGMVMIVSLTGCVNIQVVPKPDQPIAPEFLPHLDIPHSVAVLGEFQKIPTEVLVCSGGAYRYRAQLDDLTRGAIIVLEIVFASNKIEVNQNGKKQLKLSIIDAKCESGGFALDYIAKLKVVAGDSIVKEFSGHQRCLHLWGTPWAVEMAITNAVLEMLKDDEILAYLKGI
ncbi:MAG: hypothetical protein KAU38_08715 [Desulfobacterales bacterium]|nr:hypothetical protein [Desulfobacterales bacterium]